jgi:hypothetical protein
MKELFAKRNKDAVAGSNKTPEKEYYDQRSKLRPFCLLIHCKQRF